MRLSCRAIRWEGVAGTDPATRSFSAVDGVSAHASERQSVMRPGDQRVLAFLSRTGEATVSTANAIADMLKLPVATVQESLERLATDGLVSSHGQGTVV